MDGKYFDGEWWQVVPGWKALNELEWLVTPTGRVGRASQDDGYVGVYRTSNVNGYRAVCLTNGTGARKKIGVHALVMAAFVGPRPAGQCVNHRDGDKANNRLANLEYTTTRRNILHAKAIRAGLLPAGASANDPLILAMEAGR